MSNTGYNLYAEAERLRYTARDPHVPLNQSLSDAIVLLTYAAEQLAGLAEIERLRAENAAMREIVEQVADAGHHVMQFPRNFGNLP
jgi:hypothetical protein